MLSEATDCAVQSQPRLPVPSPARCVPTHPTHLWKVRCAPGGHFSLQLWLTSTKKTMTRLSAAVLSIFFFPLTTKRFFTPFIPLPTCTTHTFRLSSSAWWFLSRFLAVFPSQNKNILISSSKALCFNACRTNRTFFREKKKASFQSPSFLVFLGSNSPWNMLL